ncbi:unnamed protein product [Rhizoctonia solani]|uniref:Uncharacterized protein n=1 Tax=Rhizoctonia solani TaxID=456999 RepID=A0A8H3B4X0_9AGAM|nr:unnamed protein product [Rhizoctonia solani]
MPPGPERDGRYGPLLSELIGLQELSLPLVSNPSRNEIRQAIYSLSDPESVSYMTFATILAMQRAPACNYLALLASDACIFPACIKLLRKYCHVERQSLFDHAYGLLCFQTIVLSIQIAILLQTEQLDSFLATITNQPHGSSICSLLCDRVLQAEIDAGFGPQRRQTTWLLGWYEDEIAGRKCTSCLQQIGGFTINDTKFLVEQTWPDQRQCWIHFIDIGSRYALCSTEAEDTLMPAFLENGPDYSKSWKVAGMRSTLGAQDSNHIVQAFLTKLQDRPKIHILFSSMLLSYAYENLERPDTHKSISCVFLAILDRSWAEVIRVQELNAEQFGDLLNHIANLLRTMTG